jgi:hypothetical protein
MAEATCDIGLIGLAVMGQNLVLNMNDHGYKVAVFNRTVAKVDEFLSDEAKGTQVVGAHSVEELCASLKLPRRVIPIGGRRSLRRRGFCLSGLAFPAGKRVRGLDLRLCREEMLRHGPM